MFTAVFLLLSPFFFLVPSPSSSSAAQPGTDLSLYIDLWSNKLYVMQKGRVIKQYTISSGRETSPSPVGQFTVTEKSRSWGGGFGTRWLGLDVPWGTYGIHGTNKPQLIGKKVSKGCIRMRNEDVEELFEMVHTGTKVRIDGPITGTGLEELRNLSLGSKGNLVQLVQERLRGMGFYYGKAHGIFDVQTEWAVKRLEKANGLPMDGVVGRREYIILGLSE